MSEDSQLVKAVADVTHPFQPQGKKASNSLLEASLADRRHRDSVYLAVLARAVSCTDRQPIVARCFAFVRKYLSRCPPTPYVCEQLLDGAAHITDTIGDLSEDLSSSIQFVQHILESLLVALEEKMGGKSSKLGSEDDTRLDKLRKRRLTASKGSSGSVNVIPTNVQDSPYPPRATNETWEFGADGALGGPRVLGASQEAHMSTSPVPRSPEVLVGVPTRHSAAVASPSKEISSSGEAGGNMSATINLLAHRWQLHPPPKPGTARADAVAVLAAWPQLLAHSGRKLFRNRDDVVAAHETAPRWHLRGDFRSAADCAALVATDAVGAEHLRSIAQMQLQLAKQAGLRPRLGAAAAQEAASPFPANVRSLFSYKRYSEQEPLNITAAETAAAVVLVLGPEAAAGLLGPSYSSMLVPDPAALSAGLVPGTQAVQVEKMASIVVKLIMDMWLQTDPLESFALMLPMLRGALAQQDPIYRVRAFDLVYNLSLHAQMIEPVGGSTGGGSVGGSQDAAAPGQSLTRPPQRKYKRMQPCIINVGDAARSRHGDLGNGHQASLTRVEVFLQWLRCLLFQMLLEAVNLNDRSEALWRSALGCLLHLVSAGGHPNVECMAGLSNAPLAVLLQVAESHAWSFEVQGVLTCMACRLCYVHTENDEPPVATTTTSSTSISLSGASPLSPNPLNAVQLAALGGVPAVFACLHRAVTERARDAALAVLLDAACARVARLDPSSEAYLRGRESHRVKSLLTSEAARNAVALVAASADSIGDASAATTEAADAASSHVAEVGRANHPPTRAATSALHSLLCALAPTAADADGGVAWVASAAHAVDACLGKDEFARNEKRDALKSMMLAPDPTTRRRVARILASLFWRGRSASVRDALKTFIQGPALYRAVPQKALAAISLLSPPPAPSSDPSLHVSTALSPLLDTLAEQLSTPATAARGRTLLLDIFHVLLTTFLCRKSDIHAGLADDCFEEDSVPQASGMLQTLPHSARTPPRDADIPNDLLSPISHFLQGRSFMPSLVIMTLQPDCLLALLHALSPPPPSAAPSAPSRCERTGFAGWHSIPGAGAASGGSAADSSGAVQPPSEGGSGGSTSAARPAYGGLAGGGQHGDSRVDTGVREGLTVGHASVRDARLAVYIILLVKYRLDGAALEAGGGCKELQKALQDEDVRVRHVVAEFILERAQRHRAADHQAVLATRLVPIAQTSSRASLVDNPYIQLQAVLASDLLSIDDL